MFTLADLGQITDVRRGLVWSPDELRYQIACSRSRLEALGIARHDRIVIAHGGTPEFFADLFAAWSLGACCVCLNVSLTRGELATVVDFVVPRAVLVSRDTPVPVEGLQLPVVDTRGWKQVQPGRRSQWCQAVTNQAVTEMAWQNAQRPFQDGIRQMAPVILQPGRQ